jgi:hypothetical protein
MKISKKTEYSNPLLNKRENLFLNEISNKIYESGEYSLQDITDGKYNVRKLKSNWEDYINDFYYKRFDDILTVSVWCKGKKNVITVWDKRQNQPFSESKYCDYEGTFGRYQFPNFEEFWNHLTSDYGINWIENPKYIVHKL